MKFKKAAALVMAAALAVTVFAGCGSNEKGNNEGKGASGGDHG